MRQAFHRGHFPYSRMRRLRSSSFIRHLAAETDINVRDLILPLFVVEGFNQRQTVESMPGIKRLSIDYLIEEVIEAESFVIPAVVLFPMIEKSRKTQTAEESYNENGLIQTAIRKVKSAAPKIAIIADVALDPYTAHGHDGIIDESTGYVLNDTTNKILVKQALSLAHAGADIVAPSDMMDGRIGEIRKALDKNGFKMTQILSYAVKYASSFYGPFRDAVGTKGLLKSSKKNYQMDFRNSNEALREVALDIKEGADMVMVKPGLPYLDIIKLVKENFKIPVMAYQVSGEYSLLENGIKKGLTNNDIVIESLIAFKRAGANAIVSYYADRLDTILK